MPSKLTKEEIVQKAKKRVDDKKSFFSHLTVYLLFNIAFIVIWAVTSPGGYIWWAWPLCGWGVAVGLHALGVFVFHRDSAWEQKSVEKEAEKIRKLMDDK